MLIVVVMIKVVPYRQVIAFCRIKVTYWQPLASVFCINMVK